MVVGLIIQTKRDGMSVKQVPKALLAFERGQRSKAHITHSLRMRKMRSTEEHLWIA